MEEITSNQSLNFAERDQKFIYIHTPFCGTCHLARKMLNTIEEMQQKDVFYELNASFFPNFMQEQKIESVPCLLIVQNGKVEEKIYAFQSVTNIYNRIQLYTGATRN